MIYHVTVMSKIFDQDFCYLDSAYMRVDSIMPVLARPWPYLE